MSNSEITNLIAIARELALKFTEKNKYFWFKLNSNNTAIVIISIIKIIELNASIIITAAFEVT
jgi:hypothetical protein